ncbi:MAG TPA: hypothetical protein VGO78_18445 [Acidimicrobiales bacterium]|jgi:hypothetical protein|nr:hypothetical protein [Acidimicrobiales bacterium]
MAGHDVTSADLDELVGIVAEATSAFIGGDMRRYFSLIRHTGDDTLMPPTGGDITGTFEVTDEVIEQMEQWFTSGERTLEWRLVHRHADALVHPISQDQLAILARG